MLHSLLIFLVCVAASASIEPKSSVNSGTTTDSNRGALSTVYVDSHTLTPLAGIPTRLVWQSGPSERQLMKNTSGWIEEFDIEDRGAPTLPVGILQWHHGAWRVSKCVKRGQVAWVGPGKL